MENRIKQILIIRKDLNMRKGKIAAQAAHASLAVFFNKMKEEKKNESNEVSFTLKVDNSFMLSWIEGRFVKICVYVNSKEELIEIYEKAKAAKLPCSLIEDAGFTEFKEPTFTAVAIGPDDPEKIDLLTKHLPLY